MDMTDEQVKAWMRAFELAGIDAEKLAAAMQKIADAMLTIFDELVDGLVSLCRPVVEMLENLEKRGVFSHEQTARKKKRERDRRQAIKQENAARFRQYKATETAWKVQKRTAPRRREWRGPTR